jgi:hypothetical protein
MITELRKSINSILYQRVSSPLFGTLILSWIVWNWKIIYLTFFINSKEIELNKIEYISTKLNDPNLLIWYPLVSAILLLTIIPFVSNGAYWLSLKFDKWKVNQKNSIEKKQLLTLEQSIQLREQIVDSEKKFDSLLQNKNDEIKQLKLLLQEYQNEKSKEDQSFIKPNSKEEDEQKEVIDIFNRIKDNQELLKAVERINYYIQGGYTRLADEVKTKRLSFFEANDLIESKKPGMYNWTEKGKQLNRLLVNLEPN